VKGATIITIITKKSECALSEMAKLMCYWYIFVFCVCDGGDCIIDIFLSYVFVMVGEGDKSNTYKNLLMQRVMEWTTHISWEHEKYVFK
jgi:hypothetical protein